MAFLGLLAVLVVGLYFLATGTAGLARRLKAERLEFASGERLVPAAVVASPAGEDVAVLITAHDRQDRIIAALNSAAMVVPLNNIHVVSDDSTDQTADLARGYGVKTVETFGRLGPAGAIDTGIDTFRLLDEFKFVLLLDVDTLLDPHHLQQVLPRFDDPEVVAVDVRVDPGWRSGVGRLLSAHRARGYALAQWVRRQPGGSAVFGALPSVARTYRTSALAELERTPAGLATPDFDTTLRLHRLGRLEFCADVGASPSAPVRLGDYLRQTGRWYTTFWQAVRAGGATLTAVDLALTSLLFALLPVAAGLAAAGLVPLAIPLTVLLADYLVTLTVAISTRQPRYLIAGLFTPLLRVLDGVTALRTLPRARRDPSPDWLAFGAPEPEPADPPAIRSTARGLGGLLTGLGWLVAIAAAAAVVIRVALTATTLPPSSAEPALVDATYGQGIGLGGASVDTALVITNLQLRLYTTVTLAFDRHAGVLLAARETSIVAVATMVICLGAVAAILRVRPLVTALVLGMLAVSGPAITLLTPIGPGVLAAGWVALAMLAAVASIGWHDGRGLTAAAIALLGALVTAPILIVPIGFGAVAWVAGRRWRTPVRILACAIAVALAAATAIVLWRGGLLTQPAGSGLLDANQRLSLLGVIGAAALGGLITGWLRPAAAAVGGGAVFVAAAGSRADVLLPSLMLAAAILIAVMIEEAAGWEPEGGRMLARRAGAGLAAAVALTGSIAAVPAQPPVWTPPEHAALAGWFRSNVDSEVKVVAPIGIWADLDRDLSRAGLPAGTVRRIPPGAPTEPEELVVTEGGAAPAGVELVRFGSLAVTSTDISPEYLTWTSRARAGGQLAENPRLHTTGQVLAALRAGQVELRAMALLAALCRDHAVTVAEASKPAHEAGSPLPYRTLVLSAVDGRPVSTAVLDWLHAQQPPYAPTDIRVAPNGVTVSWRLPARLDQPPPS